jgi:AcrR family transcriptional regulator
MMATRLKRRSRARRGEGERLRTEIVDATEALLIQTGDADAVSIRAVATAVGITPPSIYMHFDTKDDLIFEVCQRNFRALDAVIRRAMNSCDDPVSCVKAMARAYVRFGLDHLEHYRLLFMTRGAPLDPDVVRERIMGVSGFSLLVQGVQRCIDEEAFAPGDAFMIACALWMGVHGMTSLLISKPTFPWPKRNALIERSIDGYCRGFMTTPGKGARR